MRGREQRQQFTSQSIAQAETALRHAIKLDPSFAPPYAFLSDCYVARFFNGWDESSKQSLDAAFDLAKKAVELAPTYARAQIFLAHVHLSKKQHAEALVRIEKSLVLEPNSSRSSAWLGRVLLYAGRFEEAVSALFKSMSLDPYHHANFLQWLGQAYFQLRRFTEAADYFGRHLIRVPHSDFSNILLASTYGHLGRLSKAHYHWRKAIEINPRFSLEHMQNVMPYKNASDIEHLIEGLRKANCA